jgi:predicted hydrocarbon binding protein
LEQGYRLEDASLSSDAWSSLQDGLYRKFSTGASLIILEMGFSYGGLLFDSLSNAAMANPESDPPNIQDLAHLMFKEGWGKLKVTGDLEKASDISFEIRSCVFCEGKNADEYKCNFVRGIILGLSTGLFHKQYKSVVNCVTNNDGHLCMIRLSGK